MSSPPLSDPASTWNTRFAGDTYLFGTEPNSYLRRQAWRWKPGDRVLCVADGEGRNSVWLARQGLRVDAFDISEVGVGKAESLAASAGVSVNLSVEDCDSRVWHEDRYDGIAAIFVQFADPAMRARLFANMLRTLKPDGCLLLQGYTPKQLEFKTGGPPFASNLYTTALLRQSFADMEIVELVEYEDDLTEGAQHHGRSALIGMVARKTGSVQPEVPLRAAGRT